MITEEHVTTVVRSIQMGCQKFPDSISALVVLYDHENGDLAVLGPEGVETREVLLAALHSVESRTPEVSSTIEPLD